MADTKITSLQTPQVTTNPATDVLPIVNIADTSMATSGSTRKITVNQLLGAGGTATLASATITGDLTVRTNKLQVTSTGVGVGKTPLYPLDIDGNASLTGAGTSNRYVALLSENSTYAGALTLQAGGGSIGYGGAITMYGHSHATYPGSVWIGRSNNATGPIMFGGNGITPGNLFMQLDTGGVCTWYDGLGGTRMTLNSTGLGIGESPSVSRLQVRGSTSDSTSNILYGKNSVGNVILFMRNDGRFLVGNGTVDNFIVTETGNVGIGVAPSAWAAGYKVIQGQIGGFALSNDNSSNNQFRLSSNAYFDTTDNRWEYYGTSTATAYEQRAGEHRFYNAISGSANTLIPFVQAMTLDASGNLLVASTSTSLTTGTGLKILQNSGVTTVGTVGSSSSDVDTTYRLYSSTASAYRFYVGYGGTVYATNTTISAISDARLKENVQDIDVGLGAILALKPRKFDWKAGKGKDIKGDRGFIAQEFEQVFPQLVDEWADPSPEGEAPYKSVRQDLIPVLVKAIQELTARVQTLETR